ncbi:hypothetical protein N7535_003659 [Penicillium sp. DV-2018c]|nr:hypothetical protein N7535_003659 [Penicillium sp. DV-2018c]
MKAAPFWASVALLVPQALAQTEPTTTTATATTSTTASPSCTASLITKLCDYPEPGSEFAVAASGPDTCWNYCNSHTPCSFVIFAAGNPHTGTGTCWLYPGETFDESKGKGSNCGRTWLSVYSQPECTGGSPTTTAGACTATATPSAIASVCGYPSPGGDCAETCYASAGASDCLSLCAEADSCSYVVFQTGSDSNSPYVSGTCWVYTEGKYDAGAASACDGAPDQFVYKNVCPKPPSPKPSNSSSSGSASTTTLSGTGTGTGTGTDTGTAVSTSMSTTSSEGSAATGLSISGSLALGALIPLWQALQ